MNAVEYLDALLTFLAARARIESDPALVDLTAKVKAMIAEERDPNQEDEDALAAFLQAERDKLHS